MSNVLRFSGEDFFAGLPKPLKNGRIRPLRRPKPYKDDSSNSERSAKKPVAVIIAVSAIDKHKKPDVSHCIGQVVSR